MPVVNYFSLIDSVHNAANINRNYRTGHCDNEKKLIMNVNLYTD